MHSRLFAREFRELQEHSGAGEPPALHMLPHWFAREFWDLQEHSGAGEPPALHMLPHWFAREFWDLQGRSRCGRAARAPYVADSDHA
jgi:hypothetical protein